LREIKLEKIKKEGGAIVEKKLSCFIYKNGKNEGKDAPVKKKE
jgi:hypothetical protein